MTTDPAVPRFPYQQAADWLRQRITSGELAGKLPGYQLLAQDAGVSPMTMQRALKVLKDEGLVYSVPALGTFVRS